MQNMKQKIQTNVLKIKRADMMVTSSVIFWCFLLALLHIFPWVGSVWGADFSLQNYSQFFSPQETLCILRERL